MINQNYHIVFITNSRPKKSSYHLKIWYLESENYYIISKAIFRFLKFIKSYWKLFLNFKAFYIISYLSYLLNKTSKFFKILVFRGKESLDFNEWDAILYNIIQQKYCHVINICWKISYYNIDAILQLDNYNFLLLMMI